VVGAGVLADDEDRVGELEVVERDGALADADGLGEAAARRLVAHVGAVGQVVGAELADEELIKKGGLVRGAPGGVEGRLVGARERAQRGGDGAEGFVPTDGLVVRRAAAQNHRVREAALLAEPVVGLE
jgi:hypothetical protein